MCASFHVQGEFNFKQKHYPRTWNPHSPLKGHNDEIYTIKLPSSALSSSPLCSSSNSHSSSSSSASPSPSSSSSFPSSTTSSLGHNIVQIVSSPFFSLILTDAYVMYGLGSNFWQALGMHDDDGGKTIHRDNLNSNRNMIAPPWKLISFYITYITIFLS
eukprot:TRINITY_DN6156_c0_g1_i2.p1 TRINITY_DN6156_c0_g1~~TRINITY_DN6156_c0_g1_i2.p1  ORF type:complete len:159 (-),score=44.99 TRINITY_DN6156_c0_g1_i2:156-632(-)